MGYMCFSSCTVRKVSIHVLGGVNFASFSDISIEYLGLFQQCGIFL
jgi:hypothetical protein